MTIAAPPLARARYVMGDYAVSTPAETFAVGGFDRHPTEIARMVGTRLVYASEN